MSRKDRKFYHAKKSAATSDTKITTEYRALNVGLEDPVFTFGKTKCVAKFEVAAEFLAW